MVLLKGFNELKLLLVEADFYQIEGFVAAIEDHQRITEVKDGDGIVALFCISHSEVNRGDFCSVYKKPNELILNRCIVVFLVTIQKLDHTCRMII